MRIFYYPNSKAIKTIILLIIIHIMSVVTISGQHISTCQYDKWLAINYSPCLTGDYTLVFEDEFNGNQIDTDKWYTYFGYGIRCQIEGNVVFLDENVSVNNGMLTLVFNESPGYYDCEWGNIIYKQYASGMIWSKSSYLFGVFEAEIKIPNGSNFLPAFWLWGVGGEIDIFEFNDDETSPEFSVHKWPQEVHHRCTYEHNGPNYSADFHTYSTYWDPFYIAFFIDGHLKYVHWLLYTMLGQSGINCNNIEFLQEYLYSRAFPSNQGQNIILNHGSLQSGTPSPLPSEMLVNYVRAWQKIENVCINKTISKFDSDLIMGKHIVVDGDITVNSEENITLIAQDGIVIKPGLKINQGATFKAEIISNLCSEPTLKYDQIEVEPMIDFSQIDSLDNLSQNKMYENNINMPIIFPNPVESLLNIYTNETGEVQVLDISGKELISLELNNHIKQIDMGGLKNGFYIVKLRFKEKTFIKKVIKQ
jgi:beta-glucanase (GH16 family)